MGNYLFATVSRNNLKQGASIYKVYVPEFSYVLFSGLKVIRGSLLDVM